MLFAYLGRELGIQSESQLFLEAVLSVFVEAVHQDGVSLLISSVHFYYKMW